MAPTSNISLRWQEILSSVALVVFLGLLAYRAYDKWIAYPGYPEPLDPGKRYSCTVNYVLDGDTFECREGRLRIRLLLMDAPEIEQRSLGTEAADRLYSLMPPGTIVQLELDHETRDKYGRILAYAWLPDRHMANEEMVRTGYAVTFMIKPNAKYRERIQEAQRLSKASSAGLWAVNGFACPPVAFRYGRCQ